MDSHREKRLDDIVSELMEVCDGDCFFNSKKHMVMQSVHCITKCVRSTFLM
jgi:hypothetical protein